MLRRSRIIVSHNPFYRSAWEQSAVCFFTDEDYLFYLEWLKEYTESSDLLTPHVLYQSLGKTGAERQEAYRELFRYELESEEIDKIRKATNGNFALGDSRFTEEICEMLGRRVTPGKAGRPRKNTSEI